MRIVHTLASIVLGAATTGVTLLGAAFALSAAGDQRAAAMAFIAGVFLSALFGFPGLRIGLSRARAEQAARVRRHIDAEGASLYERYVALTQAHRANPDAAANWRREVECFRSAMKPRPALISGEEFHELVTDHMAAMRARVRGWGKRPDLKQPVSIALPRRVEAELAALGWRAKAVAGPGVLGPVVLASRAGIRVALRCEGKVLSRERAERAVQLKRHYRADIVGVVCGDAATDEARALCLQNGVALLSPGGLRAIYPRARKIWKLRKDKRDAMAAGVRTRAQAPGR